MAMLKEIMPSSFRERGAVSLYLFAGGDGGDNQGRDRVRNISKASKRMEGMILIG